MLVGESGEGAGGDAERHRAGEAAQFVGAGKVRLKGGETTEAVRFQGGHRGVQFAVAVARGNYFAGAEQRVLDLEVFKVGPEHGVARGVRLDAHLHEVGVVPRDAERRGGNRLHDVQDTL